MYTLRLEDGKVLDSTLFRLRMGTVLNLYLAPSLYGRQVSVFTNHPAREHQDAPFYRDSYRRLSWHCYDDNNNSNNNSSSTGRSASCDETAMFVHVPIVAFGSFRFYFTYDEGLDPNPRGSGCFVVDPMLACGPTSAPRPLPMDCVQCQTVISKSLGPLDQWLARLRVSYESGFNMVHFTPVQALGGSNSAYSLSDQLKINPAFNHSNGKAASFSDLHRVIDAMNHDWHMLSVCDIVLNHTANESPWLRQHPECGYNLVNSPHLRPAYLLDRVIDKLTRDMLKGRWRKRGLGDDVTEEKHLQIISDLLHHEYLPPLQMHEFVQASPARVIDQFVASCRDLPPHSEQLQNVAGIDSVQLLPAVDGRRHSRRISLSHARQVFYIARSGITDNQQLMQIAADHLRERVLQLNARAAEEMGRHLAAAVRNIVSGIRYERLATDGPRVRGITWRTPLVAPYFTTGEVAPEAWLQQDRSLEQEEAATFGDTASLMMAHNGWVMGDDPLRDFARPGSEVYLRRELVAWGDSVKLRYGQRPADCPYLWQRMRRYVEQVAQVFHGVRLDNCHSTPLHVAEYMLDAARRVRPNLYVIAELFTNNDSTDNVFVNRLGINSLIREAMSANDCHEQGRLVYLYGGEPVGSFSAGRVRPLQPSRAHALFVDQTHDNASPVQRRCVYDLLPSAALLAMACCASGSNRGYDELVPHHIHVVNENRLYSSWQTKPSKPATSAGCYVDATTGIIRGRKLLNDLHYMLAEGGFTQVYVDQVTADIVTVTRHNPLTHQSYVLTAHAAFQQPHELHSPHDVRPLRVEGTVAEVVLQARLQPKSGRPVVPETFVRANKYINGLDQYELEISEHASVEQCFMLRHRHESDCNVFEYAHFPPGSIVVLKIIQSEEAVESVARLRYLSEAGNNQLEQLQLLVKQLSLADINRVLYRCDQEERDEGRGSAAYNVPDFGPFVYCGLQSVVDLMAKIGTSNDLGHPLCANLRQGNWLMGYIVDRLLADSASEPLGQWMEAKFRQVQELPRYLIPSYFHAVIKCTYQLLIDRIYSQMSEFIRHGCDFTRRLALGSVQFGGVIESAPLPQLSSKLAAPVPPSRSVGDGSEPRQVCVSISAGLPHFSTGYMRNWGRDTFIALRGLFLLTGRFQEARYILLAFAGCLRHGLIPNLLDAGVKARFNCRDAVWWWLYCIQEYVGMAPEGISILHDKVSRLYPTDNSPPLPTDCKVQPLCDVIQEALQRHFDGVSYRERNAGPDIDRDMSDPGFNSSIGVDRTTGFVYGGNVHNCGTWMDKMGSSERAGNLGRPATPRDGSAVELVGLCRSTVGWLARLHTSGKYPYSGVCGSESTAAVEWSWHHWAELIDANFERCFYIDEVPGRQAERDLPADLIYVRGMYKDSVNASQFWADTQLRCNFPIAMVVAPEMFNAQHAWTALRTAERELLAPLGMRTLFRADWAYCGDYHNDNDSDDPKLAHGFNYHNGPEWVWPVGYFLRARLLFAPIIGGPSLVSTTIDSCKQVMSRHYSMVCDSPWRSLPELTNTDGAVCPFSCDAQAWSMGCLLEVVHHIRQVNEARDSVRAPAGC